MQAVPGPLFDPVLSEPGLLSVVKLLKIDRLVVGADAVELDGGFWV